MASSTTSRRFPTSLNGGEQQEPDDIRVGEAHQVAREGHDLQHLPDVGNKEAHPDSMTTPPTDTSGRSSSDPEAASRPPRGEKVDSASRH